MEKRKTQRATLARAALAGIEITPGMLSAGAWAFSEARFLEMNDTQAAGHVFRSMVEATNAEVSLREEQE